jgi:hypothetical protein
MGAAAAAIVFGIIPLLQGRKKRTSVAGEEGKPLSAGISGSLPIVVGEISQEPPGFQPRGKLLVTLGTPAPGSRVMAVQAVTGAGVGKTYLAAAYAGARLAEHWRLVAWTNAEGTSSDG